MSKTFGAECCFGEGDWRSCIKVDVFNGTFVRPPYLWRSPQAGFEQVQRKPVGLLNWTGVIQHLPQRLPTVVVKGVCGCRGQRQR